VLENLKKQVVDIAKRAEASGLCKHKAGNFSIRDKETGYIVVTPSSIDREELTHHDICVVDLNAKVIEALTGLKPTSELLVHLAIYKKREDVNAVAHTHSRFATSFAIVNKPIPPVVYECALLGLREGYVPVAPYGRPGTQDLADKVADTTLIADLVLMESHGAIAVDGDAKEALLKANYVEELAELYYRSMMINGGEEPKALPLEELQKWEYPKEIQL